MRSNLHRTLLAVSLALLAFPASAISRIVSVTPSITHTDGGDIIVIRGSGLSYTCPILCPPTNVRIGGVVAEILAEDYAGTMLVVRVPAHAPGMVHVIYEPGFGGAVVAQGALEYTDDFELIRREKVLIPVIYNGPAGGGSLWQTTLTISNHSDEPVDSINGINGLGNTQDGSIPPMSTFTSGVSDGRRGLLFYPPKNLTDELSFNLRIRDLSRETNDAGTAIPIVRDHDFIRGSVHLLNIPNDPNFRSTLRIYIPENVQNRQVRVIARYMASDDIVASREIELGAASTVDGIPSEPAYGELSLGAAFPLLNGAHGPIRIEVEPMHDLQRLWAFVSVTSNSTQHVTLITP